MPETPDPWGYVANLFDPLPVASKWYCDRVNCDGEPHDEWHFCEHSLPHPEGDEYWKCRHARASQCPPEGKWRTWLLMAGRGFGKSRTGAEWIAHQAKSKPMTNWAAVAPTRDDLKATMFEGDSGILNALDMHRDDDAYNKTDMVIRLPNGSMVRGLSAERPERTRGPNLAGAWLDEICVWRFIQTYDDLSPALRRGDARTVITTTPRPIPLIKELVRRDDGTVRLTRGSMSDNKANLSKAALDELTMRWAGTRLARQELEGELLEDDPGALWTHQMIENTRCEMGGVPDFSEFLKTA